MTNLAEVKVDGAFANGVMSASLAIGASAVILAMFLSVAAVYALPFILILKVLG
jgi:hypothetical protein